MANKLTLENILKTYTSDKAWVRAKVEEHADYPKHTNECGVCNKMRQLTDNAEQAIFQWVADEVVGAKKDQEYRLVDTEYASTRKEKVYLSDGISRNKFRTEQRQTLKAHGWRES